MPVEPGCTISKYIDCFGKIPPGTDKEVHNQTGADVIEKPGKQPYETNWYITRIPPGQNLEGMQQAAAGVIDLAIKRNIPQSVIPKTPEPTAQSLINSYTTAESHKFSTTDLVIPAALLGLVFVGWGVSKVRTHIRNRPVNYDVDSPGREGSNPKPATQEEIKADETVRKIKEWSLKQEQALEEKAAAEAKRLQEQLRVADAMYALKGRDPVRDRAFGWRLFRKKGIPVSQVRERPDNVMADANHLLQRRRQARGKSRLGSGKIEVFKTRWQKKA